MSVVHSLSFVATTTSNLYTNNIDIKSGKNFNLCPNATYIHIGTAESTITTIKCYLKCLEFGMFQKGINCSDTSTFTGISFKGIINDTNVPQNNLKTDCSSLTSTAINISANDGMTNNLVTTNIGCGNLNSSNNITCIKLNSDKIKTSTLAFNKLHILKGRLF